MLLPLLAPPPITVDLIWSTDCPVAQRWVTKVASWQASRPDAQVRWWFPVDDSPAAKAYATKFNLRGEVKPLQGGSLAFDFALDRFPSTVIRRANRVVFAGGIGAKAEPDSRFLLAEAYSAAVAGKPMIPARSEPQGCTIPDPLFEKANSPVTYLKHVRPTIKQYCLPCHAPGGAAPFRLDRPADAKRWSHMILDVLERRKMPPVRLYDRVGANARRPAPTSAEIEQIKTWREYGAPSQNSDSVEPQRRSQPLAIPVTGLTWPQMGRIRFVDVSLPKVDRTQGYVVTGAPQGSVRMAWTFLAPDAPRIKDQGERWKTTPDDWEFVNASIPETSIGASRLHFNSGGRRPIVRLLLYGTGDPRPLKFNLIPIPIVNSVHVRSVKFPIETGRFPAFDGVVEQTSIASLINPTTAYSLTVVGDPSPNVATLLGPASSWFVGEFTPNSFMPTIPLTPKTKVSQLTLNASYGGHSITGERGPNSIAFGDRWNEARLEAYLVVQAQQ